MELSNRAKRTLAAGEDPFAGLTDEEQHALVREAATSADAYFRASITACAYADPEFRHCRVLRRTLTDLGLTPSP